MHEAPCQPISWIRKFPSKAQESRMIQHNLWRPEGKAAQEASATSHPWSAMRAAQPVHPMSLSSPRAHALIQAYHKAKVAPRLGETQQSQGTSVRQTNEIIAIYPHHYIESLSEARAGKAATRKLKRHHTHAFNPTQL